MLVDYCIKRERGKKKPLVAARGQKMPFNIRVRPSGWYAACRLQAKARLPAHWQKFSLWASTVQMLFAKRFSECLP